MSDETCIRFLIDKRTINKTLTADDMETIEMAQEGEDVKMYRVKRMAARFLVDEQGTPIPYEKASRVLGRLTVEELGDALHQFFDVMKGTALPNESGSGSNLPSEAGQAATLQDGQ